MRVHLARRAPNTLVGFEVPGLKQMPGDLTAAEIHSLTVADGEGRVVLKVEGRQDRAERNRIELMPEVWTLTVEGTKGQLTLYALDGEDFLSDDVLDALAARLGTRPRLARQERQPHIALGVVDVEVDQTDALPGAEGELAPTTGTVRTAARAPASV